MDLVIVSAYNASTDPWSARKILVWALFAEPLQSTSGDILKAATDKLKTTLYRKLSNNHLE